MSREKAIATGKERRRPYYRSGRVDRSCRPGGDCPWCLRNRTHQGQKARRDAALRLDEGLSAYADGYTYRMMCFSNYDGVPPVEFEP